MMPGNNGGTNWEGGAFDPETRIAYIFSSTEFNRRSLVQRSRAIEHELHRRRRRRWRRAR